MDFGERLRKLRKERKLTQKELSLKSGISQQAISNTETGRTYPESETIRLLANVLKISTAELLGEEIILSDHKLTPREFTMITEFRKLNPAGQKQLIELATFYQTKEEYQRR